MKIVTGAKATQFKSMRFRNYCKFSCTSGSVHPKTHEGRARPRVPGNGDVYRYKIQVLSLLGLYMFHSTIRGCIRHALSLFGFNNDSALYHNIFRPVNASLWLGTWRQHCNCYAKMTGKTKKFGLL